MSNRSSQDDLPTRSTTNTQTFLETCVLDDDHKTLKEHLMSNPVQQSDLDKCLLRGLQIVQRKEKELSHVAPALTILLQHGAKWNSDELLDDQKTPYHIICESSGDHHELLDHQKTPYHIICESPGDHHELLEDQKTPYHIICESPGDHHELLELMIKSSQQTIIDAQDVDKRTAVIHAVRHANINCLKSLITNGADVNIGNDKYRGGETSKQWTAIMVTIENIIENKSAINVDIFDVLLDGGADVNKPTIKFNNYFMSPLSYAAVYRNVYCVQKLIENGARLDIIANSGNVWALIAEIGNVELLKCLFNQGIDKNSTDHEGYSVLWRVVASGNVEALQYLLDLGVSVDLGLSNPSYKPEQRKKNKYMVDIKQEEYDPCILAIFHKRLDMVKLLEDYGSISCEFFTALKNAVRTNSVDVASYLLNKYKYPLNMEYTSLKWKEVICTLLTEPRCISNFSSQMIKLLLEHGADPAKPMCSPTSVNAIMTAICYKNINVIAQYIRSRVNINLRSYDDLYENVLPFEASVLHGYQNIAKVLLISGCSCGVFSLEGNHKFKDNLKPEVVKLMKEWKVQENNVTPLMQRCRSVILNHLSARADQKIEKLPLPGLLIQFLNISEIDDMVDAYNKIHAD